MNRIRSIRPVQDPVSSSVNFDLDDIDIEPSDPFDDLFPVKNPCEEAINDALASLKESAKALERLAVVCPHLANDAAGGKWALTALIGFIDSTVA